jgi:hypothetical protein
MTTSEPKDKSILELSGLRSGPGMVRSAGSREYHAQCHKAVHRLGYEELKGDSPLSSKHEELLVLGSGKLTHPWCVHPQHDKMARGWRGSKGAGTGAGAAAERVCMRDGL